MAKPPLTSLRSHCGTACGAQGPKLSLLAPDFTAPYADTHTRRPQFCLDGAEQPLLPAPALRAPVAVLHLEHP